MTMENLPSSGAKEIIAGERGLLAGVFGGEKEAIEAHFKKAEEDRLLYVAATRPKQMLVISQYPENPKISTWTDLSQSIPADRELIWEEALPKEKEALEEAPDLPALLTDWNHWLENAKNLSFKKSNVTSIVKGEAETVVTRSKKGKAPVFGTVIHSCMEEIGKAREDIDVAALQTVQAILASEIWRRVQQAEESYYEFSFLFQKDHEQLQGVIDFLFREDDGWTIVDYKTDTFDESDLALFVDYYRTQVELYSQEFEENFHFKVKEKGLYFTSLNQFVVV